MSVPATIRRFTPQEYYQLEREAAYKSDYYDGEIFAMSGGTAQHSLISSNLIREIGNGLKGKPCTVYESNLRLKIMATGLRTYPDAAVYCGPLVYDTEDPEGTTATNPTAIFEVLSKTTEGYDRGFKAENYRRIDSLQAYVLVAQDAPHVEVYERREGGTWLLRETRGLDAAIAIPAINIDLPLAEIYAKVEFPPPGSPTPSPADKT